MTSLDSKILDTWKDYFELLGIPNYYVINADPVTVKFKGSFTPVSTSSNNSSEFTKRADSYEEDYVPERVIFLEKEGITIALWKDETMTTAKASGGDKFQPEIGVAIVTMKKIYGSTTNFWNFVEEAKLSRKVKGLVNGFCA